MNKSFPSKSAGMDEKSFQEATNANHSSSQSVSDELRVWYQGLLLPVSLLLPIFAACRPLSSFPAPLPSTHPEPCSPWAAQPCCVVLVCFGMCTHPGWEGGSWVTLELLGDTVLVFPLTALCWEPCQNGGSCTFPGRCSCLPGWMGQACQTGTDHVPPVPAPCVTPALRHTCPAAAGTASPGSIPAAMGLWVSFAIHQPLRGERDQYCGSYQTLGHV